jgi:Matrixin
MSASRRKQGVAARRGWQTRLRVEELEPRRVLSALAPLGHANAEPAGAPDQPGWDGLEVAAARGAGPAIRLDIVALHEFGHSLGLDHFSTPSSIMYAFYNPNYNLATFASDPAVTEFQAIYADVNASPWKDSLDPVPGDGKVEITYSFMTDGARMDSGAKNTLFQTMNADFGSPSVWQPIFTDALNMWASVSNNHVAFVEHSDNGAAFNAAGASQNSPSFGDIRIGAHRMDGTNKTLAHTYFPPPNGASAAGDAHFDNAENWVQAAGGQSTSGSGGTGAGQSGGGSAPSTAARTRTSKLVIGAVGDDGAALADAVRGFAAPRALADTALPPRTLSIPPALTSASSTSTPTTMTSASFGVGMAAAPDVVVPVEETEGVRIDPPAPKPNAPVAPPAQPQAQAPTSETILAQPAALDVNVAPAPRTIIAEDTTTADSAAEGRGLEAHLSLAALAVFVAGVGDKAAEKRRRLAIRR